MSFKLISTGLFRKDFIIENLLDIHEEPFEKTKQKRKRLFLHCWNLQMHSGIQTENIRLANV